MSRFEFPGGIKGFEAAKEGSKTYDNKDSYKGMMTPDGKRVGFGVERLVNGEVYEGTFLDDKRHGKGSCTYANGDVFEGKWIAGLKDGPGTYKSVNGRFDGEWKVGRFSHGRVTLANGRCLEGESNDSMFGITRIEPYLPSPNATFDQLRKRPFQGHKEQPKKGAKVLT